MSNEIKIPEASDSLAKRFRKPGGIDRNPTSASDKEFRNAIDTGIKDAESRKLTPRKLKDQTNVVNNWVENINKRVERNECEPYLLGKEKTELAGRRKKVQDTFDDYKWAKRLWQSDTSTKEQKFKDATQSYLEYVREKVEERFFPGDSSSESQRQASINLDVELEEIETKHHQDAQKNIQEESVSKKMLEHNLEILYDTDSPVRDAIKEYRRIKDGIQGDEVTLKQLHKWNTQLDQSQQILKNAGADILETENFSHTEMEDIEEISKQIENRRKEIANSIYKERYIDRVIPLENTHYQILQDLGISDEEGKNFRCVMTIPKERVTKKYIELVCLQQRIKFNSAMLEPESSFMKNYISQNAFYINLYNLDSGVSIAVNNDNTNDKNVSGEPFLPNSDIVLLNQPTSVANKLNRGSSKFLLTRMYQYDITNSKTQKAMGSYFDNQLPEICKKDKEGYHGLEDTPNSKGIFYGIKQYKMTLGFKDISQIEPIKKKVRSEMMYILALDFANQSIDKGTSSEED